LFAMGKNYEYYHGVLRQKYPVARGTVSSVRGVARVEKVSMTRYIARRVVGLVPTVMMLLLLVVVLVDLIPGDIIDLILEERFDSGAAGDESRQLLEAKLGLDQPLPLRYGKYALGVFRGDFGESLWTGEKVTSLILGRAGPTIEVGALAIVLGAVLGVAIGTISAVKQDSLVDYALRSTAILGISVPSFAIATVVIVFPAIWWGVSPSLRYVGWSEDPFGHFKIILVPAIVLGTRLAATLMRLTRTTMLDVLRQDYIRTAHAKGIGYYGVLTRHALKNALIPVITLLGLQIAFLIGGSVITESVFAIPGVGRLLLSSIADRDYPVVQGVVVIIGLFVMLTNLAIDLSYAWIDPRIRYG
jgi:peptide/nickel transport system permease protein